eukprot:gene15046-20245_t
MLQAKIVSQFSETDPVTNRSYVTYEVCVECQRYLDTWKDSWTTFHRYSEFYNLHQTLKDEYNLMKDFSFPIKNDLLGLTKGQYRTEGLQGFLSALVAIKPLPTLAANFLGVTENVWNSFKSLVWNYCHLVRYTTEVLIVVGLVALVAHRLVGTLVGYLIRSNLGCNPPETEKFNISIGWISLRLGLDHNEIVIADILWKNTTRFDKSPYFIRIKEISIVIDIWSIYPALFSKNNNDELIEKSVIIEEIKIDYVDIHVEKSTDSDHSLSVWSALGAETPEQEKSILTTINNGLASVLETTQGVGNALIGTTQQVGSALIGTTQQVGSVLVGGTQTIGKNVIGATQDLGSLVGSYSPLKLMRSKKIESNDESYISINGSVHNDDSFKLSDVIHNNDINNGTSESQSPVSPTNDSIIPPESQPPKPLTIRVNRLVLHELNIHAQDLLSATHVDSDYAASIVLKVMAMSTNELTAHPLKKGLPRRGVEASQLVWLIANRLLSDLMSSNQIAMLTLLASGAASQTTAAVFNAASTVVTGTGEAAMLLHRGSSQAISGALSVLG